jgi:hypothetical protein
MDALKISVEGNLDLSVDNAVSERIKKSFDDATKPIVDSKVYDFERADSEVILSGNAKYSEISSDLIKSLFGYIADSDKTNSEAEAKALNQILNIALAAKESDDKKLFSSAPGAGDVRLPTATETVNTLLDSKAVRHALVDVLTDGNNVTVFDPYELSGKIKEGSSDYAEAVSAIYDYRAQHPEINDLVFEALAALLGVQVDLSK